MIGKHHGRIRAHKMLAKAGYGKGGASRTADGGSSMRTDGLKRQIAEIESSMKADGSATKHRLDRKGRKNNV